MLLQKLIAVTMAAVVLSGCNPRSPVVPSRNQPPCNIRLSDSNGNGRIDVMQIDHTTEHITAWIDDDHDGRFDRCVYEIEGEVQTETQVDIEVPIVSKQTGGQ